MNTVDTWMKALIHSMRFYTNRTFPLVHGCRGGRQLTDEHNRLVEGVSDYDSIGPLERLAIQGLHGRRQKKGDAQLWHT